MEKKIDALFQLWKDYPGAGGQVLVTKGGLWLEHLRHGYIKLNWLEADCFFHGNYRLTFCRDATGKVTGYLVNSPHLVDIPFQKVQ